MTAPLPTFSIVVPTYDRPRQLASCLGALDRLDSPRDRFEVIVVDDGSPSSLEAVVGPFRGRLDVTLIRQPNAGPASARNLGVERARGEFLAFTDDDCAPAPDWLRRLEVRFTEDPDHLVGGRTVNLLNDNPYSTASQILIDYLYGYFSSRQGRFFTSNNLAVSASRFRDVGGFEDRIKLPAAEDREFCIRWARQGFRLTYDPAALIYHTHTLDFRRFWRQHFTYGRGAYYFRELVCRAGQDRVKLEPFAFYSGLLQYPLARRRGRRALRLALLLGISQLANASGFFYERYKPRLGLSALDLEGKLA